MATDSAVAQRSEVSHWQQSAGNSRPIALPNMARRANPRCFHQPCEVTIMSVKPFRKSLLAGAVLSLGIAAGTPLGVQAAGTYDKQTTPTPAAANSAGAASAAKAAAAAPSAALSSSDRKFIEEAARGGLAEVELGRLAAQKGASAEVKKFGQRMVDDHSKANDKLQQIASSRGVAVPKEMDAASKREYDKLQKLSELQFDQEYMKSMVSDHQKDVKDFQKEQKAARDSDLKAFVTNTLPTLQEHLKLAQSGQAAVKSRSKSAVSTQPTPQHQASMGGQKGM
jgi:putative membrane protein